MIPVLSEPLSDKPIDTIGAALYDYTSRDAPRMQMSFDPELKSKIVSKVLDKGFIGASLAEIWEYGLCASKELLYAFLKSSPNLTSIHFARFAHIEFAPYWLIPIYNTVSDSSSKKMPYAYVQPRIWLALNGTFNSVAFSAALTRIYEFIKEHPGISLVIDHYIIF